jgi:UDP-2,4-diacetamido-2,4,6-trideoxy-beta-L-altropyranose hydrolase
MNLVVRVDSSYHIGSGHVMRCLTLAEFLRENRWTASFICRDLPGNLTGLLKERGFPVALLPAPGNTGKTSDSSSASYADWLGVDLICDARETHDVLKDLKGRCDWLLIDHYALDRRWEDTVATQVNSIMVIDDLANRSHSCDILVDHNLNPEGEARYLNLVPAGCRLVCGPAYALLRPEFERAASGLRDRDGTVRRILVFFGGVDATGETLRTCEAIVSTAAGQVEAEVVVGMANPRREQIRQMCEQHPELHFHGQVCNMAELMASADLAIGAGGTTSWERAYLGLPTIIIPVAENQMPGSEALAGVGAAWNLGYCADVSIDGIGAALKRARSNPAQIRAMGRTARRLFGDSPVSGVRKVAVALQEATNARS